MVRVGVVAVMENADCERAGILTGEGAGEGELLRLLALLMEKLRPLTSHGSLSLCLSSSTVLFERSFFLLRLSGERISFFRKLILLKTEIKKKKSHNLITILTEWRAKLNVTFTIPL